MIDTLPEIWAERIYVVKVRDQFGTRSVFDKETKEEAEAIVQRWIAAGLTVAKKD